MASIAGTRRAGVLGLQPPTGPATARAGRFAPVAAGPTMLAGTTVLFFGLLSLLLVEYIGLAKDLPFLKVMRYSTLLAYGMTLMVIVRVGPKALVEYPQSKALLAFVLFTGFTVLYAVVRSYVPTNFRAHIDYFGLYVTTLYLVDRPKRLDMLSITCAVITIFLVGRNLSKLGQEQRTAVFTAGYFMGDGNDFAWGLVTFLPFSIYLLLGKRPILYRLLGMAGLSAGLLGVMGTQSRGAALAVGAGAIFYWLMLAKRKAATLIGLAVIVAAALAFAPAGYTKRMQTIDNYQEDSSAQGRIRAWKASFSMAIDFPLGVGAGSFNSAFGRYYMPAMDAEGWAPNRWISAHSVYFKVLGEYGFLGLGIVLWVIYSCVRINLKSLHLIRANPTAYSIPETWPALVALGVVSYAVGAVFLGGITYPHLYLLAGLSVGCQRILAGDALQQSTAAASPRAPVAPPVPSRTPGAGVRAPVLAPAAHASPTGRRGTFFD